MAIPPEVLFHRYFKRPERHPNDRERYKGKQNLDGLHPPFRDFLRNLQDAFNESLMNEKENVPEHVAHLPFHFDYIDSTVMNALAFGDDHYSYIGITMPLIYRMWDSCVALSKSTALRALLEVPAIPEREESILTIMFQNQLVFVVAHEYTHYVHGHLSHTLPGTELFNEIIDDSSAGRLEDQAFEIDADGYSVYHLLAHLIAGPRRQQATEILMCDHARVKIQDEILFSSFVMAVGAFLCILPPVHYSDIYKRTHPPAAIRMREIMHHAIRWCREYDRSELAEYMTVKRFQTIMLLVERALAEVTGGRDWKEETEFTKSDLGREYLRKLRARLATHVDSLRPQGT